MPANKEKFSEPHTCPYCDAEIAEAAFPFCEACHKKMPRCPQCGKSLTTDVVKCPNCGTDIKGETAQGS